jgi:hypothetical protein
MDDLRPEVRRQLKQAAKAIRKQFSTCGDLGLHADEFWYWLIYEVDPRRQAKPRNVRVVAEARERSASNARDQRVAKNSPRNTLIRAHYETSVKVGEKPGDIYRAMSKRFRLGERQLRKICSGK